MGRKDVITKEYMEDTEVFADVFNHMIYKGEKFSVGSCSCKIKGVCPHKDRVKFLKVF